MPVDAPELIRPTTLEDIPALSALFEEVFGERRPDRIWKWKYFENPRGTTSMVCRVGERIVAHCGGIPVRFRDFGQEVVALQSVDFMSSRHYPGGMGRGGVFVRTAERFFAAYCGPSKIPLVYGFPGERHRLLGERLLGYKPVEQVGQLRLDPEGEGVVPEPLEARDLAFFGRIPLDLGAVRDPRYLAWRYLEHPTHRYGRISIRRPFGLGIAALVREEGAELLVMETAGRFSKGNVTALARALARVGKPVLAWGPPAHPAFRLLAEAGFRSTLRDHWIEFRSFTQRETPRTGHFYYTLGDYDVH